MGGLRLLWHLSSVLLTAGRNRWGLDLSLILRKLRIEKGTGWVGKDHVFQESRFERQTLQDVYHALTRI